MFKSFSSCTFSMTVLLVLYYSTYLLTYILRSNIKDDVLLNIKQESLNNFAKVLSDGFIL